MISKPATALLKVCGCERSGNNNQSVKIFMQKKKSCFNILKIKYKKWISLKNLSSLSNMGKTNRYILQASLI